MRRSIARRRGAAREARSVHGDRLDEPSFARNTAASRPARRLHRGVSERRAAAGAVAAGTCRSAAASACPSAGSSPACPRELAALTLAVGVVVRRVLKRVCRPRDRAQVAERSRLRRAQARRHPARAHGGGARRRVTSSPASGSTSRCRPRCSPSLSDWPRGAIDLATALGREPPPARGARGRADQRARRAVRRVSEPRLRRRIAPSGAPATTCAAAACASTTQRAPVSGTAVGIDADGALLIETADGERRRVVSGDVSVRSG